MRYSVALCQDVALLMQYSLYVSYISFMEAALRRWLNDQCWVHVHGGTSGKVEDMEI